MGARDGHSNDEEVVGGVGGRGDEGAALAWGLGVSRFPWEEYDSDLDE